MPQYKIGGGNKPQEYDENNGRYGSGSLVEFKTAEDGIQYQLITGKEPPMPVYSPKKDNEEYARWWVDNYFVKKLEYKIEFDTRKVTDYLLVHKEKNDKSKFLFLLGYNEKDWKEVYDVIKSQANFTKSNFVEVSNYGVKIELDIEIPSKINGQTRFAKAIWMIEQNEIVRFLTLIPCGKKGKNKMEKEINLYDVVTVKEDHVFTQPNGTMHCKKGMLGRVIDIAETPITKEIYYTVEFFDTSEIDDPVFFFSKDELVLVQTEDEETADYLKSHPEDINDEWLKTNKVDINKIRAIWEREKSKAGK